MGDDRVPRERVSRQQQTPPSAPTPGPLQAIGWGCYAVMGVVLLAAVIVVLAFCIPHGSS